MRLPSSAAASALLAAAVPLAMAGAGAAPPPSTSPLSASASALPSASIPAPSASIGFVEASPEQVVWLRSGAVVRGRIVEYEPLRKVVLQLATGEIRSIEWADVLKASWVAPSTHASAAPATPRAPAVRPAAPSGSVLVRIMPNDQRVWLESRPRHDGSAAWQPVCQAPCDRRVEVEDRSLRIAGQGLRPSNPFHVKGDGDILKLSVRPGSERTHLWGRGLFVSGITLGIASGAVYGLGRVQDSDAAVVGGIIGMAVGGVALLGSLPLLFSGRTTVRNRDGVRVGQASEGATAWPVF